MSNIGKRRKIRSIIKHYPDITEQEMSFLIGVIKERKLHLIINKNHPAFLKDEDKYTRLMEKLIHLERQLSSQEESRTEQVAKELKEYFANNT